MKDNKLFLYIFISIIIHLVILLFFPLANKAGIAGEDETRDFGFIQLVEYQPITQTSQDIGNDEFSEDQVEEEESKKNEDNEEDIEETEEVQEETELDVEEEKSEENIEDKSSQDSSTVEENSFDDNNEEEIDEVDEEEEIKEVNNNENNEEIISSEDSDFEMKINEENKESEKNEENEEKEVDENEDDNSSTNKNKDSNENIEEQEKKNAPPPPPTSGELIANTVTPQYPKDLVGESQKGTVEFIVKIDKTGEINNLDLISSSGIDQIDRTARLAIERGWKFKSYNLSYKIPITVNFNINDQGNPEIDVNLGEVEFEEVND